MESQSYAIKNTELRKFEQANAEPISQHHNIMHNVTMDCGDLDALSRTLAVCQSEMWRYTANGNIWFGHDGQTMVGKKQTARNESGSLRDSLDSLNHACSIQERIRKCLEEHGVRDYCISKTSTLAEIMDFQFICQHQKRDENLVHALQCLGDKRVLSMLFFHIGNHCVGGMDILDDLMVRTKSAYFYTLDINPARDRTQVPHALYCLPRHVISTCVAEILEDHCGKRSSRLVQGYLLYCQDWFDQALKSAGIPTDICEYNISSNSTLMRLPTVSIERHKKVGFVSRLEMAGPGTALDTVFGRWLVARLHSIGGQKICSDVLTAIAAYTACVMSSDAKYERSKFNILQFGQGLLQIPYHGTQCLRLEQFTACWNQLQDMCGPVVRGFKQHATLLVEGCKIQSEMETAGCHWQDMLLGHYIHASRVTVWPLPSQGLGNPLLLQSSHDTIRIMNDLDKVITLLQPGMEEISRKCGHKPAKRLQALSQQLRYLQYDAAKMDDVLIDRMHPID